MSGTGEMNDLQPRSVDFQSAVSPNCIRQGIDPAGGLRTLDRDADCKSAIQQIENLRYENRAFPGRWRMLAWAIVLVLVLQPGSLWACAACYGASDSTMAKGMNAGIFSLLGVVVTVLGSIAGFFVYLAKKSGAAAPPAITND
jgi:hypothetical protein